MPVGVARVDVTPAYPVRLSGYASRQTVSEGVEQRLWAKALAFGRTAEDTAVLITVDALGHSMAITDAVYARVNARRPLPRAHFAICATHTHNAPMLNGVLPNLFSRDLRPEEQEAVDRYTREFTDWLVQVALEALDARRPARLGWGRGAAGFAVNRRMPGGPVDHELPVLVARSPDGGVRAVLANYACHCTTLASNKCGGDWAGYAQEYMEAAHPGIVALVSIGCAGDANPHPRPGTEFAQVHGREIATEVDRLLGAPLQPLSTGPAGAVSDLALPLAALPTREEWEARANVDGITGYHARKNLARLDRGETLPTALPYRVQAWAFGSDLAMVFLGGEVVVDYAKRLKSEYRNLWIHAYANDVSAYIPSARILAEGGYEGGGALPYYDQPANLGPMTEPLIVGEVARLVPERFRVPKMQGVAPPSGPRESLGRLTVRPGFRVELAASEPQIEDPVAVDFGADGRLWVLEMRDYPGGMDGRGEAGGRLKVLDDPDGDGFYDRATVFLDRLPFPTGLMAWGNGAFVCAAPDILFAEDTDGDGRAERVEKWFTGFAADNFQARVNGLRYGLDGWIYGANGLLGGVVHGAPGTAPVDIGGRDFRFHPVTRVLEPVAGLTQQGRVRNDWGDWFGSDNSTFAWHYPMADRSLARNPHVPPPSVRVPVAQSAAVHPTSRTLERFNDPDHANRATGACGGDVYRDTLLGEGFYGDYFVAESVHNLVTRLKLEPRGATFTGPRAPGEEEAEFFSSSENWSRPVQVRTGTDGALWVVDMYRYVIEHPKWIPAESLATLEVRAGEGRGRVYRVVPEGTVRRPVRDLTRLSPLELAAALDTPNGPTRDLVQARLMLMGASDAAVVRELNRLSATAAWPAARAQALATLAGLRMLEPARLAAALGDLHPGVRRVAVVLAEPFLDAAPDVLTAAAALVTDQDAAVRHQLTLSLGEARSPQAGQALRRLAVDAMDDPWRRAAVLSSAVRWAPEVLAAVLAAPVERPGRAELASGLMATAVAAGNQDALERLVGLLAGDPGEVHEAHEAHEADGGAASAASRLGLWAEFFAALDRRGVAPEPILERVAAGGAAEPLRRLWDSAKALAFDPSQPLPLRQSALSLCAVRSSFSEDETASLAGFFESAAEESLRPAALSALRRQAGAVLARVVLSDWPRRSAAARSVFVDLLFERDDTLVALLEAVEDGRVSGAEIPVPRRDRWLAHADAGVRTRAEAVLAAFQPRRRAEVLAAYRETAGQPGNEDRGREVFRRTCALCHQVRGLGQSIGPDLAAFRGKGVPEFLEAILNPNGIVEPRYLTYEVELNDGRSLAGLVGNETAATLTLSQPAGRQETVVRADIRAMRPSPVSLMPEGLEQAITPAEMADLIAFLKGGAVRALGSATAESAAAARASFGPDQANGLVSVTAASTLFEYGSWLGPLPFAHCHLTDGAQRVEWRTAPAPAAPVARAWHEFRFAGGLGYLSQPEGAFTLSLDGQPVLSFGVVLTEREWTSHDGTVVLRYEPREAGPEDSNGVFTLRVRGDRLTAGQPLTLQVRGASGGSQRWFGVYALSAAQVRPPEAATELPSPVPRGSGPLHARWRDQPLPGAQAPAEHDSGGQL